MQLSRSLLAVAILAPTIAFGCGSGRGDNGPEIAGADPAAGAPGAGGSQPALPDGPGAHDLPWEVRSDQGETYLADVFYADPSQNEQVMPVALDGHTQIDRLIYPTLGNPNLYVKKDAKDSFMMVLRLEDYALAHLAPVWDEPIERSPLTHVRLRNVDENNRVSFFLVSRGARVPATESEQAIAANGKTIFRIEPSEIQAHPIPAGMPEVLKLRRTLRVVFNEDAMKDVPPGLYDVRFEVIKDGNLYAGFSEHQFNGVRVFDAPPANDEHQVINVTDTQVSVGSYYQGKTSAKLKEFVDYVNASTDPSVLNASFITFNGDLHNGGSPGGFREPYVATTYNEEAKVVLGALKELKFPIFLTAGNHDGNASTGTVPKAVQLLDLVTFGSLKKTVDGASPKAWPDFSWSAYDAYRTSIANHPEGVHRDIFAGQFVRREGSDFGSWIPVARGDRNMVLYDGFHQWKKTYGPLYASWRFGKSFYLSLNTFDLRQHRRTSWGMYAVNYGGGMSPVQLAWARRDVEQAEKQGLDVVLLAHHDPRGGHHGQDFGYYFKQLDYHGVGQSTLNYVESVALGPTVCKLPDWALKAGGEVSNCLHDGLMEWMRPDEEFDCAEADRLPTGACDTAKFDPGLPEAQQRHPRYSGYELLDLIDTHASVRTLVLGHTHYNSLEVLQSGDAVLADKMMLDQGQIQALAALEVANPVRGFSWLWQGKDGSLNAGEYDAQALAAAGIVAENGHFFRMIEAAANTFDRKIEGQNRELVVLRITSNADLTSQKYQGRTNLGFSVLHVTRKSDARAYQTPQINSATYFVNAGSEKFDDVKSIDLDRTARLKKNDANNPVAISFQ